jgi:hypothetical protein
MISQEPRRIYRKNPLAEVICQLRFPEILSIETELPAILTVLPVISARFPMEEFCGSTMTCSSDR